MSTSQPGPRDRVVLAQASHPGHPGDGTDRPWLVLERRAAPLSSVAPQLRWAEVESIDELLGRWSTVAPDLRALLEDAGTHALLRADGIDVRELVVASPVRPRQAFCTIGNYAGQVIEAAVDAGDGPCGRGAHRRRIEAQERVALRRSDGDPYICLTSPHRVRGPRGPLALPAGVETLDWEVEIAVVIGARTDAPESHGVVAGYCVANDLTIRSQVLRADQPALGSDWVQSKGLAGSLPLGPWFVPTWQVPDVSALRLQLRVNGQLMQDDVAADMIFDVDRQLSHLRRYTRLGAGDVLCTGSPAGFGAHHRRFVRPGDEVHASVAELGDQVLTCVAAPPSGDCPPPVVEPGFSLSGRKQSR